MKTLSLFPSDHGPIGDEPVLRIRGAMDYFVDIVSPEDPGAPSGIVRFDTSGSRQWLAVHAVALLNAISTGDVNATKRLAIEIHKSADLWVDPPDPRLIELQERLRL